MRRAVAKTASIPPSRRTSIPPSKQTLSIDAVVALGDIPVLRRTPPMLQEDPDLFRLVMAIDGHATVATLADRTRMDPQQARAWFADLARQECISFVRHARSQSGVDSVRHPMGERTADYWLQGLRPRTSK
jgi:hypothetical protein